MYLNLCIAHLYLIQCIRNFKIQCICIFKRNLYLYFVLCRITDVKWDGEKIVVMDQVVVAPPYKMENCSLKEGCPAQALQHVKKLVSAVHMSYGQIHA